MVEQIRTESAPTTALVAKQDARWWKIFSFFAKAKMADEGVAFLSEVDEFKLTGDMNKAEAIYQKFVSKSAPRLVNLYDANFQARQDIFDADVLLGSLDMFDQAYQEVLTTLDQDTYHYFRDVTRQVKAGLEKESSEAAASGAERDIVVSDPTLIEVTRDRIDMAVVDKFNELALKSLEEGDQVNFYQLDDLVIIWTRTLSCRPSPGCRRRKSSSRTDRPQQVSRVVVLA